MREKQKVIVNSECEQTQTRLLTFDVGYYPLSPCGAAPLKIIRGAFECNAKLCSYAAD